MRKLSNKLLQEIVDKIVEHSHPEKIILFGSYAWGNPKKSSDLDLLVVKNSSLPRHKRSIEIRRLFYDYCIPMDIIVHTPEEVEEWKDVIGHILHTIIKKGKVVYG